MPLNESTICFIGVHDCSDGIKSPLFNPKFRHWFSIFGNPEGDPGMDGYNFWLGGTLIYDIGP